MANSKTILLIGFLCALALLIVSEVSARELAESVNESDFHEPDPDDKPGFKPSGDKPSKTTPRKGHPPGEEGKKPGDKPGFKPGDKPKPGFKPGDKPKPGKGHPPKEESKN
ncbi:hypothetical protein Droror1_Dr00005355 [Drosera rotundifolia]